jgi:hypothetical protein
MRERKPFVIRGHHLEIVARALREPNVSPSARGKRLIRKLRDDLNYVAPSYLADERVKEIEAQAGYARDTIGETDTTTERFETGYREFLKTIISLPDDYNVELVAGQPDGMCNGCAIGAHCKRLKETKIDNEVIADFTFAANSQGYRDQLQYSFEKVEVERDGRKIPIGVTRIRTNMGTLRKVIRRW